MATTPCRRRRQAPAGWETGGSGSAIPSSSPAGNTCNVELTPIDDRTLLYVHDAVRYDPDGANGWLQHHGFGRMVGRIVALGPKEG